MTRLDEDVHVAVRIVQLARRDPEALAADGGVYGVGQRDRVAQCLVLFRTKL